MAEAHLVRPRTTYYRLFGPKGLWPCSNRKEPAWYHREYYSFCQSLPRRCCIHQRPDGQVCYDNFHKPASFYCRFSCTCWRDLILLVILFSKDLGEQIPCGRGLVRARSFVFIGWWEEVWSEKCLCIRSENLRKNSPFCNVWSVRTATSIT